MKIHLVTSRSQIIFHMVVLHVRHPGGLAGFGPGPDEGDDGLVTGMAGGRAAGRAMNTGDGRGPGGEPGPGGLDG